MAEVKARSDIEVAFVGSSIVRDHFNAEMISKEIGKTCFALGIPCAACCRAIIASTTRAVPQKQPGMDDTGHRAVHRWTAPRRASRGNTICCPILSSPFEQRPLLSTASAKEDGWYVDRAVHVPRLTPSIRSASSWRPSACTCWPFRTYEKIRNPTLDPRMTYMGSGYCALRHRMSAPRKWSANRSSANTRVTSMTCLPQTRGDAAGIPRPRRAEAAPSCWSSSIPT